MTDRELIDLLRKELTDRQWDCYRLRHADDLGVRRIARILGISPATVREHLAAADRKAAHIRETHR